MPRQQSLSFEASQFAPSTSFFAVVLSSQQPYRVPAQPPTVGGGVGWGFEASQFAPWRSFFAVVLSSQQPYRVPAQPPTAPPTATVGATVGVFGPHMAPDLS
jgi:hypothetical protein